MTIAKRSENEDLNVIYPWPEIDGQDIHNPDLKLDPLIEVDVKVERRDEAWIVILLVFHPTWEADKKLPFEVELDDCLDTLPPDSGELKVQDLICTDPLYLISVHMARTLAIAGSVTFSHGVPDVEVALDAGPFKSQGKLPYRDLVEMGIVVI